MTTVRESFESMAWGPAPESAATAEAWLEQHGKAFGHYIGGAWVAPGAASGSTPSIPPTAPCWRG